MITAGSMDSIEFNVTPSMDLSEIMKGVKAADDQIAALRKGIAANAITLGIQLDKKQITTVINQMKSLSDDLAKVAARDWKEANQARVRDFVGSSEQIQKSQRAYSAAYKKVTRDDLLFTIDENQKASSLLIQLNKERLSRLKQLKSENKQDLIRLEEEYYRKQEQNLRENEQLQKSYETRREADYRKSLQRQEALLDKYASKTERKAGNSLYNKEYMVKADAEYSKYLESQETKVKEYTAVEKKAQRDIKKLITERIALYKKLENTASSAYSKSASFNPNTANISAQERSLNLTQKMISAEKRHKLELAELNAQFRNGRIDIETYNKAMEKLNRTSKGASSGTTNGKAGFTETMFGGAGTSFGHKIATTAQYTSAGMLLYMTMDMARKGVQAVVEYDTAIRTLSAVLKLSYTESEALGQSLNDLGKAYGGTLQEIYGIANALGRAGVATSDLITGSEIVMKMAKLTGDTFEQSTSAVVSYVQVFSKDSMGNTIYTMEEIGDKLANIANASRMSTQDIGTFSNYALAAAKAVGLSLDAVSGLAIAFSNAGVNASTAGTQVRRFTSLLLDDGRVTTNFFNSLGLTQASMLREMKKGTEESNAMMERFAYKLKQLSDVEFFDLMQGMDLLATNSLSLIRNNSDEFISAMSDSYSNVKGELNSVSVIIDGMAVSWERVKNSAADAIIDMIHNSETLDNTLNLLQYTLDRINNPDTDSSDQVIKLKEDIRGLNTELRHIGEADYIPNGLTLVGKLLDTPRAIFELLESDEEKAKRVAQERINLQSSIVKKTAELMKLEIKQKAELKALEDQQKEAEITALRALQLEAIAKSDDTLLKYTQDRLKTYDAFINKENKLKEIEKLRGKEVALTMAITDAADESVANRLATELNNVLLQIDAIDTVQSSLKANADTSVLLESLKALDSAGESTANTFSVLKTVIQEFKGTKFAIVDKLIGDLPAEDRKIFDDAYDSNSLVYYTNLQNILSGNSSLLAKDSESRAHQVDAIKAVIKQLQEVNVEENKLKDASLTIAKTQDKIIADTYKKLSIDIKANNFKQTSKAIYEEEVELIDKQVTQAKLLENEKVKQARLDTLAVEREKAKQRFTDRNHKQQVLLFKQQLSSAEKSVAANDAEQSLLSKYEEQNALYSKQLELVQGIEDEKERDKLIGQLTGKQEAAKIKYLAAEKQLKLDLRLLDIEGVKLNDRLESGRLNSIDALRQELEHQEKLLAAKESEVDAQGRLIDPKGVSTQRNKVTQAKIALSDALTIDVMPSMVSAMSSAVTDGIVEGFSTQLVSDMFSSQGSSYMNQGLSLGMKQVSSAMNLGWAGTFGLGVGMSLVGEAMEAPTTVLKSQTDYLMDIASSTESMKDNLMLLTSLGIPISGMTSGASSIFTSANIQGQKQDSYTGLDISTTALAGLGTSLGLSLFTGGFDHTNVVKYENYNSQLDTVMLNYTDQVTQSSNAIYDYLYGALDDIGKLDSDTMYNVLVSTKEYEKTKSYLFGAVSDTWTETIYTFEQMSELEANLTAFLSQYGTVTQEMIDDENLDYVAEDFGKLTEEGLAAFSESWNNATNTMKKLSEIQAEANGELASYLIDSSKQSINDLTKVINELYGDVYKDFGLNIKDANLTNIADYFTDEIRLSMIDAEFNLDDWTASIWELAEAQQASIDANKQLIDYYAEQAAYQQALMQSQEDIDQLRIDADEAYIDAIWDMIDSLDELANSALDAAKALVDDTIVYSSSKDKEYDVLRAYTTAAEDFSQYFAADGTVNVGDYDAMSEAFDVLTSAADDVTNLTGADISIIGENISDDFMDLYDKFIESEEILKVNIVADEVGLIPALTGLSEDQYNAVVELNDNQIAALMSMNTDQTAVLTSLNDDQLSAIQVLNVDQLDGMLNLSDSQAAAVLTLSADQLDAISNLDASQLSGILSLSTDQTDAVSSLSDVQLSAISGMNTEQLAGILSLSNTQAGSVENLSAEQTDAIASLSTEQILAIGGLNESQVASLLSMNSTQLGALTMLDSNQLGALAILTTEQTAGLETLTTDQLSAIGSLDSNQIEAITTLTNEQVLSLDTLNTDQLEAIATLDSNQIEAIGTMNQDQLDGLSTAITSLTAAQYDAINIALADGILTNEELDAIGLTDAQREALIDTADNTAPTSDDLTIAGWLANLWSQQQDAIEANTESLSADSFLLSETLGDQETLDLQRILGVTDIGGFYDAMLSFDAASDSQDIDLLLSILADPELSEQLAALADYDINLVPQDLIDANNVLEQQNALLQNEIDTYSKNLLGTENSYRTVSQSLLENDANFIEAMDALNKAEAAMYDLNYTPITSLDMANEMYDTVYASESGQQFLQSDIDYIDWYTKEFGAEMAESVFGTSLVTADSLNSTIYGREDILQTQDTLEAEIENLRSLIDDLESQKVLTTGFSSGGFTSGIGQVDSTGYRVAGVVHEDEWVAPKWMVEAYPDAFNSLEQVRTRGYAAGGYTSGHSASPSDTSEVEKLRKELSDIKQLSIRLVAIAGRQLNTQRAALDAAQNGGTK